GPTNDAAARLRRIKNPARRARGRGGDAGWRGARLGANHVRRVQPFVASLHLDLHHLPFSERLEAVHLDGREVHEHVLAALLFNEAVPLGIIEPFHLSLSYSFCLLQSHPFPWGAVAAGPAPMSAALSNDAHQTRSATHP